MAGGGVWGATGGKTGRESASGECAPKARGTRGGLARGGKLGRAPGAGGTASQIQEVVPVTPGAGQSWSETSPMQGVGPQEGREHRGRCPGLQRQIFPHFGDEETETQSS
ncbi:PREDICTED: uncharacterized protein KIAA0040 homolog isoform X1 [Colobus angolensis palliatus]|uniref:uncharacterized protein KIAA0040 homolog isoform X1 n=1 Tax=Colobus angolensis palliatus TaxID=336983 RepID=UPI0005F5527F|nr:PREDICTED: uncharacterized protein KIAA0040 homolog isoform X1 [Colobus angolensis palliatus]